MNGFYIVIDVNSGAIHTVDELAFLLLNFYRECGIEEILTKLGDKFLKEDIEGAYAEICHLEQQGLLYSKDSHEEISDKLSERDTVIKALCFHIAHDCNLRCEYCFAKDGGYGGNKELMSINTGKAAIDFLIANSGSRKNLEVDFFGGEPLLNFNVVKEIVGYGNEHAAQCGKAFRFTLTTNGILLDDEKTRYINEKLGAVVLSIDGRKEIHDAMRKNSRGVGTYDMLVPKFKRLVDERAHKNYYVRGTYTRQNLDFCEDVFHLHSLGFLNISLEPAANTDSKRLAITEDDLERIYAEYERLAIRILDSKKEGRPIEFFHYNIDLSCGPCAIKRVAGCGAGTEYLAVAPSGDLFPCHQFVGHEAFKMGNVFDGINRPGLSPEFKNSNLYTKEKCKTCFAKYYCGGGCAADGFLTNGNINEPGLISCALERKRVECALMIKVAEQT